MRKTKQPLPTWIFDQGILTVTCRGETVSLGRYATRAHATKAAALYIALHAGEAPASEPAAPAD